jgi:peptidoglycan/xylan/chitin deacetylase (PgdA/CDA1 family)
MISMDTDIDRRQFILTMGAGIISFMPGFVGAQSPKRHIITLSFDDGFKKSSLLTAEIFEKHKLSACINIVATGHLLGFKSPDEYQVTEKGDFGLWNELKARGHEIMPHGYKHANKTAMPLPDAQNLVVSCLDYFSKHLKGFKATEAIFNMPYNASTPELEAWLTTQVLAFRTGGATLNAMPHAGQKKLTCGAFGPGNCEEHLDRQIKTLLELPEGWLIYNLHGLNDEGWGPIRTEYLDRLLARLVTIDSVSVMPAGKALMLVQK